MTLDNPEPADPCRLARAKAAIAATSRSILGAVLLAIVLLQLCAILSRQLGADIGSWTGETTGLLLLCLGWIGGAHLWLIRGHLTLGSGQSPSQWQRRVFIVSEAMMLIIAFGLAPAIQTSLEIYSSLLMPASEMPASIKYVPMVIGLIYIALGSVLNLTLEFTAVQDRRR